METQRADPGLRRIAIVSIVALSVVCAIALWALQGWLDGVAQAEPAVAQRRLLTAFAWLVGTACASLLAMALHLWRSGSRVMAAGQFPLPGMRVVRDTAVLRGAAALRRGRVIRGIAVALVLSCLALGVAAWRVYVVLCGHTG